MLSLRGVEHAYEGQPVLRRVDLEVAQGEIVCLLGESGSGKTTLLRRVAGLESGAGAVWLADQRLDGRAVHERELGLMFQDYALFPHMNVAANVAFGLRMRGLSRQERDARVNEVLKLVGLEKAAQRDVEQLSGGERQRVALARSLAPRPRLLMLDEPLGSLDAALRERLVVEVRAIIKRLGLTALYVTHDQQEAFAIADRVAVMRAGRIVQIADPETLYYQPRTAFVARFLGLHNVLAVQRHADGRAHTALGAYDLPGQAAAVLLHPDGISLSEDADALQAEITESVFRGDHHRMRARPRAAPDLSLQFKARGRREVGAQVGLHIDPAYVRGLAEG